MKVFNISHGCIVHATKRRAFAAVTLSDSSHSNWYSASRQTFPLAADGYVGLMISSLANKNSFIVVLRKGNPVEDQAIFDPTCEAKIRY